MVEWYMNDDELEGIGKKAVVALSQDNEESHENPQ